MSKYKELDYFEVKALMKAYGEHIAGSCHEMYMSKMTDALNVLQERLDEINAKAYESFRKLEEARREEEKEEPKHEL